MAILPGAVLQIDTRESALEPPAEAVYLLGNRTNALTFLYTVAGGDASVDLGTYERGEAGAGRGLVGTVLRNSDAPTQVS